MNQVCALGSLLRLEACVSVRSGFHDRTPQTRGLKHRAQTFISQSGG